MNFALFSAHAERVDVCIFDSRGRREIARYTLPRIHRRSLARLPARTAAGRALRLPRLRPVRPAQRAPLQPPQAAARSVRQSAARPAALERRALRLPHRRAPRRPELRPARQRRRHAEVASSSTPSFTWGDDRPPDVPWMRRVFYETARARLHDAAPRRAAGGARHVRRPRRRRA